MIFRVILGLCVLLLSSERPAVGAEVLSARESMRRAVENFRSGKIKESVADFEQVAELEPGIKAELWQLGIAYYYAGEFAKGRDLFELHQKVNPQDVENAVWHFLCVARLNGLSAAREKFISITNDSRVPMKEVHALFAGKLNSDAVLAAARAGDPGEAELKNRLFFAHLYLGLYEEALGNAEASLKHISAAAKEFQQKHYMGDVAQVHLRFRQKPQTN
jgi:lipoprotein NlpI